MNQNRSRIPTGTMLAGLFALLWLVLLPLARAATQDTPSSRIIRLNYISGSVSYSASGSDDWVVASLNRPLTQGDRLWVERGDRAELHLGSTAIRLAGGTGVEVLGLNDEELQLKVIQGSVSMRVRDYPDDEDIEFDTPDLAFEVREPGEYRIDVDPERDTTIVGVRKGSGTAFTDDESLKPVRVYEGQRVRFTGESLRVADNARLGSRDDFDRWAAQRDNREESVRSVRYVSRDMTGYEDLDDNGDWQQMDGYGAVWYPRITIANWAPYQYGHWAWIAPWGWTWIDDAPWGFAPFHYGRWAMIGGRWGWIPGPVVPRPVYAPALVAFVGGGNGSASWSISLSSGSGIAWFPLGPGEPYRPEYTRNAHYLERINGPIPMDRRINVYANQRIPQAIAVMPERDFLRGASMRPGAHPEFRTPDMTQMQVRPGLSLSPVRESRVGPAAVPRQEPPQRVFGTQVVRQPAAQMQSGQSGRGPTAGADNGRNSVRQPEQQRQPDQQIRQMDQQQQQDQQRRQQEQQRQQNDQRRQMDQQRQQQQMQPQQQQQQRQQQQVQQQQQQNGGQQRQNDKRDDNRRKRPDDNR